MKFLAGLRNRLQCKAEREALIQDRQALLDEITLWRRADSETDNHPCPDPALRRLLTEGARRLASANKIRGLK